MKAVAQAEAITSALVPEAERSDFAQLGGAALEELVPEAISIDVILGTARKQAILAAGEVAERLPSLEGAAGRWFDQLAEERSPSASASPTSTGHGAPRVRRAADRRRGPAHGPADRLGDRRQDRHRQERVPNGRERCCSLRVSRRDGGRSHIRRRASLAARPRRRRAQPPAQADLAAVRDRAAVPGEVAAA